MTALLAGAIIASLGIIGAQLALLFWQMKRATKAQDGHLDSSRKRGQLQRHADKQTRAIEDLDKAIDTLTAERIRLEKSIEVIQKQRDALLEEAFKQGSPTATATAIRNALNQLSKNMPEMPPDSSS